MKLGFLGYGNLARALDRGICSQNILPPENICICAKTEATLATARGRGHMTCVGAAELFALCDIVVLAIKPRVFREMKYELSRIDTSGRRVVSVMAAVHIGEIAAVVGCPVMRVMPTLAAADAKDIIGYCCGAGFDDVAAALGRLGDAIKLDEAMLDRLTVASSCGLGFAAHMLESYKKECISYGFAPEQAETITRRMFSYAAEVREEGADDSFSALESRVATKGGATEAGNLAMDTPLREAISAAFDAAGERAIPKKE